MSVQLTGHAHFWHPTGGDAGADPDKIQAWIEVGRERRATANLPPFSGGRGGQGRDWWTLTQLHLPKFDKGSYCIPVGAPKIRLTAVIMDVLDVLTNAPSDDPAWGLRLCEVTGYGTGTIYPALDRLMKAGWITDHWEYPPPQDRPRRRLYEVTSTGRENYMEAVRKHNERRATWLVPSPRTEGIS